MDVSKNLFDLAIKGNWDEFVYQYEYNFMLAHPSDYLNVFADTPLHLAISNGAPEDVIVKIVQIIYKESHPPKKIANESLGDQFMRILAIGDDGGNTPLHLAVSMASLKSCIFIAEAGPKLGEKRNKEGETPLFLAAARGRTDILFCLHHIIFPRGGEDISWCRKNSGETILHCATRGEYWDLAYLILLRYSELAGYVDDRGILPLHLLAKAPSTFTNDFQLGFFNKIVYRSSINKILLVGRSGSTNLIISPNFTSVGVPEPINPEQLIERCKMNENGMFPMNYQTCFAFFQLLRFLCLFATWIIKGDDRGRKTDEEEGNTGSQAGTDKVQKSHLSSRICYACLKIATFVYKLMLYCLGFGSIVRMKQKHILLARILEILIQFEVTERYFDKGTNPMLTTLQEETIASAVDPLSSHSWSSLDDEDPFIRRDMRTREAPILIAAKNGIIEVVEGILSKIPKAVFEVDSERKSIVLLAVEHKQPEVYKLLTLLYKNRMDSLICKVDNKGNSALHLAAKLTNSNPWPVPGAASQMQWEIRWYEYIMQSMPRMFQHLRNEDGKIPEEIFWETHTSLIDQRREWLKKTSSSCSVVAGLIVTATFPMSTSVPGGVNEAGSPFYKGQSAFNIFAISSYVSFYSSLLAVVLFLSVFTSSNYRSSLRNDLPTKLLLGLTAFYVSIASTAISFSAGHYFIFREQLKSAAFPAYPVVCLVVIFFSIIEFPLYFHLAWATFKRVPERKHSLIRGYFGS